MKGAPPAAMLKIATYNIRKAIGLDRRRDPARILSILADIDADIIALQEADRRFGARQSALPLKMLEAETGMTPVFFHDRPHSIGWHGNALLVRKGTIVHQRRALDLPMLEPRGAVMADIEVAGHGLRVVGMHLDLSGLWRRRQVRAILGHLGNQPHHLPTLLMGDMNQWTDSGALSEFAFHHFRILRSPPSYHSSRPIAPLDRIIVGHEFRVGSVGVHDHGAARVASDHLPVVATLGL